MKRLPFIAAAVVFAVHLAANPHYGYFRDELYFIICGRHPAWGYVDQPPLVPLLAAATQIARPSLFLLRAVPALFAAGGAYVTCLLVLEFGGGRFAQALAAAIFLLDPVLAAFGGKVGTDEVGLFCWPLLALLVTRIARGGNPRLWLWAGAVAGISFNGKYSIVFFVAALVFGLMLTPERRILWNASFAGGLGIAVVLALPNVIWQGVHGWPMLELLRNGANGKNVIPSPPLYALQQILITNPLLAAEWIAGLVWLFTRPSLRFAGYAYLALIAEMLALHGKHYYPANVYPILIAAGAVAIETWTARRTAVRPALALYVAIAGGLFLPDALPILPENTFVAFARARNAAFHIPKGATETEHGRERSTLPGDWADMHGWPEMAATVRRVYDALPDGERRKAVVFAGNYGEASAVAFFAPEIPVISEHNQYWLWGTKGYTDDVVVQVNGSCFHDDKLFASRTRAATVSSPYAIANENDIPVWVCRHPARPLAAVWPEIKDYE